MNNRDEEVEEFLKQRCGLKDIDAYFITVTDKDRNAKYISYGQEGHLSEMIHHRERERKASEDHT